MKTKLTFCKYTAFEPKQIDDLFMHLKLQSLSQSASLDTVLIWLFFDILLDDLPMGRLLVLLKPRHISLCVVIKIC